MRRLRDRGLWKRMLSVIVACAMVGGISVRYYVYAFDERFMVENNILFYNPNMVDPCATPNVPIGTDISIIGDSTAEDSRTEMSTRLRGVVIDAKAGRKLVNDGSDTGLSGAELAGIIESRNYVVLAFGSNDHVLTENEVAEIISSIGENRKIIFVTSYNPDVDYETNNEILRQAERNNANVRIADWGGAISEEPEKYTYSDGINMRLTGEGKVLFVDTVYTTLGIAFAGNEGGGMITNTDYAGNKVFNEAQLSAIEANRPFYERSAKEHGIPWQMIAAIHMREHSLRRDGPSNGYGPYQITPSVKPVGAYSDEQFQAATDEAAAIIKSKSGGRDLFNLDNIKYTFFAYNGTAGAYKEQAKRLGFSEEEANNGEGSPYVMNRTDLKRDPTVEPTRSNSTWGQIKKDYGPIEFPANSDYGAFIYYSVIAGVGGECEGTNITQMALGLSWPDKSHAMNDPRPEYVRAMTEVGLIGIHCKGAPSGASCDVFVATVYRKTVDPNFPCCGAGNILSLLRSNKNYIEIPNNENTENMQTGDIMVHAGHIMMYVRLSDGSERIASASCNQRTADHAGNVYFKDGRGTYHIFRWVGAR